MALQATGQISLYNYQRHDKPSELYTITEEDLDGSVALLKFTYI